MWTYNNAAKGKGFKVYNKKDRKRRKITQDLLLLKNNKKICQKGASLLTDF